MFWRRFSLLFFFHCRRLQSYLLYKWWLHPWLVSGWLEFNVGSYVCHLAEFFVGAQISRKHTHFWWIRIEQYSSISIGVIHHAWQFKTSNTNHAKPIHNTKRFGIWMPWLLGIGSYDKHQCGQSTFGAWRWGLHVGRRRGCLNRINQWGGVASLRRCHVGGPSQN